MAGIYSLKSLTKETQEEEAETPYCEVYSEDTRRYWKIIRVGNHTEAYQTFNDMLKKLNIDDLDKLWSLVKERFGSTDPTDDKERTLWVELKRLFEPDSDDILWKLQRYMHDPLTWRLYDICGVHHVSTDRGHDIFMLFRGGLLGIKGFYKFLLLVQFSTAKRRLSTAKLNVPSTSERRLIELKNQVQRLMEAQLALTQPTQVNKITSSCEICSGPYDTQYCMENPEQAFVDYASSRTDRTRSRQFAMNQEPRNFNEAANTWKGKPNFNWAHA
ncbi:hypothetical protein Tco_1569715 [Tanacetum coccineum]